MNEVSLLLTSSEDWFPLFQVFTRKLMSGANSFRAFVPWEPGGAGLYRPHQVRQRREDQGDCRRRRRRPLRVAERALRAQVR